MPFHPTRRVMLGALAVNGHAAAAPPRSVMNSRRFTASDSRASNRKDSTPPHRGRSLPPFARNEIYWNIEPPEGIDPIPV
jgi:hypothetical protein